jgi:C4-dicarboxylate-specific signal transduction histidine kinase
MAGSAQAAEAEKGTFNTEQGDLVLSTEVTPLRDQGGALTGTILMTSDITERARLEQELMRMEKLATVGQMVVTINHEINNPLLIISTNAQAMRLMNPDLDEKTTKKLYKIEAQVKRISEVTERLRTLDEVSSEEYITEGPQMIDLWGKGGASGKDDS